MNKKTRIFVSVVTSLILILPLINCLCAIAADSEDSGGTVSKTITSIILILIFIIVSVFSALLTYKIKRNKSGSLEKIHQSSNYLKNKKNQED